jgi:hypothetical protein
MPSRPAGALTVAGMARIPLLLTLALLLLVGPAPARAAGDWKWPVRGEVITRYRNGSDPYAGGQHRGVDIAAPVGRAVSAPTPGRITFAGTVGSSGLTVSLRTADGRWDTSYLHLSAASVRRGQEVGAGERLGAVGTTGRRSASQPHLHFGVREAGSRHAYHDPMDFLAPLGRPGEGKPGPVPAPLPLPLKAGPGSAPIPAAGRSPARARARARPGSGAPGLAPRPAAAQARSAVGRALAPPALTAGPATRHARQAVGAPGPAPAQNPAPSHRGADAPAPIASGAARAPATPGRGMDLGWALACLGLVAAALALGRAPAANETRSLRVFRPWRTTSRLRSTT